MQEGNIVPPPQAMIQFLELLKQMIEEMIDTLKKELDPPPPPKEKPVLVDSGYGDSIGGVVAPYETPVGE